MIISYIVQNYRSIREEITLDFRATAQGVSEETSPSSIYCAIQLIQHSLHIEEASGISRIYLQAGVDGVSKQFPCAMLGIISCIYIVG